MDLAVLIAERRIREAIERGELDGLSGSGSPLKLDDDSMVPEDKRLAFKILKNSGFIPPELELKKELFTLGELISTLDDGPEREQRLRELNFKLLKFNTITKRPLNIDPLYEDRLVNKLLNGSEG